MDEEWDVDEIRGVHECDEHWELRREFILRNKDKYPKVRILSLSQVFANVEFLGCKYPEETMELVAELSSGIVEEYRKKQSARLQRTFIKASSAAETKIKLTPDPDPSSSNEFSLPRTRAKSTFNSFTPSYYYASSPKNPTNNSFTKSNETYNDKNRKFSKNSIKLRGRVPMSLDNYGGKDDLLGLVLIDQLFSASDTPAQKIHRSCQMCGKEPSFLFSTCPQSGTPLCTFKLGNYVCKATGSSKEGAKQKVCEAVINELGQFCHTIVIKRCPNNENNKNNEVIQPSDLNLVTETSHTDNESVSQKKQVENSFEIGPDNVGNKLLRMMGWTGGGLGKNEDGVKVPVLVDERKRNSRHGLGHEAPRGTNRGKKSRQEFERTVYEFLSKKFKNQGSHANIGLDAPFSPSFSKFEREIIHRVAAQLELKSKSYGKGNNRFIVVSQKISLPLLLKEIIQKNNGENEKYKVIFPKNEPKNEAKNKNINGQVNKYKIPTNETNCEKNVSKENGQTQNNYKINFSKEEEVDDENFMSFKQFNACFNFK